MFCAVRTLVISLLFLGCGAPPKDPAVTAYQRFVAAVRAGSGPHVWRSLTPESQRRLAELVGVPGAEEDAVLERLAVRPGWPFELDLPRKGRSVDGGTAEVRVVRGKLGDRTWALRVVKVGEDWRIDLFGSQPVEDGG